tara:strand:- start:26 stop:703 length:678 start_codon:yes stop_codon:yes gene_type:complete
MNSRKRNELQPKVTVYDSVSIPNISVELYLTSIVQGLPKGRADISGYCLLVMCVFIDRIKDKLEGGVTEYNVYRLIASCLLLAIKYNEDQVLVQADYAKLFGMPFPKDSMATNTARKEALATWIDSIKAQSIEANVIINRFNITEPEDIDLLEPNVQEVLRPLVQSAPPIRVPPRVPYELNRLELETFSLLGGKLSVTLEEVHSVHIVAQSNTNEALYLPTVVPK